MRLVEAETPPFFVAPDQSNPEKYNYTYQEMFGSLTGDENLSIGTIVAVDYDNEDKKNDPDAPLTEIIYSSGQDYDGWLFEINSLNGELI